MRSCARQMFIYIIWYPCLCSSPFRHGPHRWSLYIILRVGMCLLSYTCLLPRPVPHKAPWLLPRDWLVMTQWCMTEEAAWFKKHAGDRFTSIGVITRTIKKEWRHKMTWVILQNLTLNQTGDGCAWTSCRFDSHTFKSVFCKTEPQTHWTVQRAEELPPSSWGVAWPVWWVLSTLVHSGGH